MSNISSHISQHFPFERKIANFYTHRAHGNPSPLITAVQMFKGGNSYYSAGHWHKGLCNIIFADAHLSGAKMPIQDYYLGDIVWRQPVSTVYMWE